MPIDENGVHSAVRLNIGDKIEIPKYRFTNGAEIGEQYILWRDSDHWTLKPNDGLEDKPCVVRVEDIEDDTCKCVVTKLHREER